MYGGLLGQRPESAQPGECGAEQWGVVSVARGGDGAERDAVGVGGGGAFQSAFAPVHRARAGVFASGYGFGVAAVDGDVL